MAARAITKATGAGCIPLIFAFFVCAQPSLTLAENQQHQLLVQHKLVLLKKLVDRFNRGEQMPEAAATVYREAQKNVQLAETMVAKGQYAEAEETINLMLKRLADLSGYLLPKKPPLFSPEAYQAIADRLESYSQVLRETGSFDQQRYASALSEARNFYDQGEFQRARETLARLTQETEAALIKARENQVLIHSVSFSSPEERWQYELQRNENYHKFVLLYTEQNPLPKAARVYADTLLAKNRSSLSRARQVADDGDYEQAITLVEQGTDSLVRVLKMAGVPIP